MRILDADCINVAVDFATFIDADLGLIRSSAVRVKEVTSRITDLKSSAGKKMQHNSLCELQHKFLIQMNGRQNEISF